MSHCGAAVSLLEGSGRDVRGEGTGKSEREKDLGDQTGGGEWGVGVVSLG